MTASLAPGLKPSALRSVHWIAALADAVIVVSTSKETVSLGVCAEIGAAEIAMASDARIPTTKCLGASGIGFTPLVERLSAHAGPVQLTGPALRIFRENYAIATVIR